MCCWEDLRCSFTLRRRASEQRSNAPAPSTVLVAIASACQILVTAHKARSRVSAARLCTALNKYGVRKGCLLSSTSRTALPLLQERATHTLRQLNSTSTLQLSCALPLLRFRCYTRSILTVRLSASVPAPTLLFLQSGFLPKAVSSGFRKRLVLHSAQPGDFVPPYYVNATQALTSAHEGSHRSSIARGHMRKGTTEPRAVFRILQHPRALRLGRYFVRSCGTPSLLSNSQ